MAVSKNHPREAVIEAMATGQRLFGENRVQEAVEKFSGIDGDFDLHIIGHLQRNKVRDALSVAGLVQSVDSSRILRRISSISAEMGQHRDILIEVNTSGEESKFGLRGEKELFSLLEEALELPMLRPTGLMTMAPFVDDEKPIRASFRRLRELFLRIERDYSPSGWKVLSMGMSSDFPIAIEEGSTLLRIGTAIFGGRD